MRVTKRTGGPTLVSTHYPVVNTILSRERASLGWLAGKQSHVASVGKVP